MAQDITIAQFLGKYDAYLTCYSLANEKQWKAPVSPELATYIVFNDPKFETLFKLVYGDEL